MSSNTNPNSSPNESKTIDYAKLIPFASAGLVLLGVSKLIYYYTFFAINVLSYLDLGEIITLFLDDIVENLLTMAIELIIFLEIILPPLKIRDKKDIKNISKRQLIITIIAGVIAIGGLVNMAFTDNKIFRIVPFLIIAIVLMGGFFLHYYKKFESRLIKDLCILTFIVLASEGMIYFFSVMKYLAVKDKHLYSGTRVVFNNEILLKDSTHVLISDSSNYYIGKTKNYIFVYHTKPGATSVYPMSNIVQIDFSGDSIKPWFVTIFD
jgi:hypothetical protein